VKVIVNSTPITVGSAVADSSGKVTAEVVIPAGLAPGSHTLSLSGASRTVTFPFVIAASSSGTGGAQLPRTGSNPGWMVLWAACLLVFGRIAVRLGRAPTRRGAHAR
jgi:hypothetical protein